MKLQQTQTKRAVTVSSAATCSSSAPLLRQPRSCRRFSDSLRSSPRADSTVRIWQPRNLTAPTVRSGSSGCCLGLGVSQPQSSESSGALSSLGPVPERAAARRVTRAPTSNRCAASLHGVKLRTNWVRACTRQ